MKALIFAAGLGTRLKEYTNNKPKALVEINGKTLLQRAIENLTKYGIDDITINVHHFADSIISFLETNNFFGVKINISDERNELLETGGGLKKAKIFLEGNEPIIIYNVDIICNLNLTELIRFHIENRNLATLVVRDRDTNRKLMVSKELFLTGWINTENEEKKICNAELFNYSTPYAFSGIHVVNPEIFDQITEEGKFSVIDMYLRLAKTNLIGAYIDKSDIWIDVGKPDQLQKASNLLK